MKIEQDVLCFHCGDICRKDGVVEGELAFCCRGCLTVYHLLKDNNLDSFYDLNGATGISLKGKEGAEKFEYLDDDSVRQKLLDFSDGTIARATFYIPQMYCSACIWLLENLHKLNPAIVEARVNFPKRSLAVTYREGESSLRSLVELLAKLGYTPKITLQNIEKRSFVRDNRRLILQTGIAGFAFANIMLFSFPDYLAGGLGVESSYQRYFSVLSVILALPVFFYSAVDFFRAAYQGLRVKQIHLDLPLSIGIIALFARSVYDVATQSGTGYFDSFTGLVFFLLIGRVFQSKTYQTLTFDRDYKSYFPLSVTLKEKTGDRQISLARLKVGDVVVARQGELIVADSALRSSAAEIDYSFVTGESRAVKKIAGDILYAGGRVVNTPAEMEVVKDVSQGYLVSLWSSSKFASRSIGRATRISQRVGMQFTISVLAVAVATFVYWLGTGLDFAIANTTAALIVACPCALALAIPFTFGTVMQIFGRRGLFLREQNVVENLAQIETIVFDKTGTLTSATEATTQYDGEKLSDEQMAMLKGLAAASTHPLSRRIAAWVNGVRPQSPDKVEEIAGQGISGRFGINLMKIGSQQWISGGKREADNLQTEAHLAINDRTVGKFYFGGGFREASAKIVPELRERFDVKMISGDNAAQASEFAGMFGGQENLRFNQSPHDKLEYVDGIKSAGKRVLMIGDGLNDSGALAAADVGIALTEDVAAFSPASDAIFAAESLKDLPAILRLSRNARRIVMMGFALSLVYNVTGVYFAVTGQLSPLIAAVLMPVSSVSVVGSAVLATRIAARKAGLR
ncbi:MAG: heavy metal translocating P-type ATPase metal-binding domain-containing protein [Candidatus Zixiibacteriota bacterium]